MREHPGWRSPLHTIRDNITFASATEPLRMGAFGVLDAIQFHPPAVQLDALFLLATVMALVVGKDPHEMVTRAKRMAPDVDGPFTDQLAAIGDYAKGELKL